MNAVLLAARLVLAAVFCASGAAKLFDRDGTRATAVALGVPAWLGGPAAVTLPGRRAPTTALPGRNGRRHRRRGGNPA